MHAVFFCFTYRYVNLFPEMINAIGKRIRQNKAKASGVGSGDARGHALVGFGPYSSMTRKGLSESVDQNHKSYVRELLHHPVTHSSGQLDKIKQYLIRRQQEQEKNDDDALARFADEVDERMGTYNK